MLALTPASAEKWHHAARSSPITNQQRTLNWGISAITLLKHKVQAENYSLQLFTRGPYCVLTIEQTGKSYGEQSPSPRSAQKHGMKAHGISGLVSS